MADAKPQSKPDTAAAVDPKPSDDTPAKTTGANVEAVAEAVGTSEAKSEPVAEAVKKAVEDKPASTTATTKRAAKKSVARKATVQKTASKTKARKTAARKTTRKKAPIGKSTPARPGTTSKTPSINQLKETIMATASKKDTTSSAMDMTAEMQERAQAAFAKVGEFASEAGEFSKANVEAMVESGKIWFSGAQDLMRENMESGKTAIEAMTDDAKKVASAKSPTEFMQLQSEMARRNFDAMVSYGSERTEAWVKLYNDAIAPISNRASVAAEKMSKVA